MPRSIDFYFDLASPPTYLAHVRLQRAVSAGGIEVAYRPMLLGGILSSSATPSPPASRRSGAT